MRAKPFVTLQDTFLTLVRTTLKAHISIVYQIGAEFRQLLSSGKTMSCDSISTIVLIHTFWSSTQRPELLIQSLFLADVDGSGAISVPIPVWVKISISRE
jgi:hypothetical protein